MTKSQRGFTLIELLIVIAIIGILSMIVLTSLGSVRQNSKYAQVVSNVKKIALAYELSRNQLTGNFPIGGNVGQQAGQPLIALPILTGLDLTQVTELNSIAVNPPKNIIYIWDNSSDPSAFCMMGFRVNANGTYSDIFIASHEKSGTVTHSPGAFPTCLRMARSSS